MKLTYEPGDAFDLGTGKPGLAHTGVAINDKEAVHFTREKDGTDEKYRAARGSIPEETKPIYKIEEIREKDVQLAVQAVRCAILSAPNA